MKRENEENENQPEWPNLNSLNANTSNNNNNTEKTNGPSSISSNISTSNSSIPTLQHYLITFGKIKQMDDELLQNKYITRHDADGKFTYLEAKLVVFFLFYL